MQTRDHLYLARRLLETAGDDIPPQGRAAFLFGCMEPDINPVTYLCRANGARFRGHNFENRALRLRALLTELSDGGLSTLHDYFALGAALHYLADAFTYPHNAAFPGDLHGHVAYEKALHPIFLAAETETVLPPRPADRLWDCVAALHDDYLSARPGPENDSACIWIVCALAFEALTEKRALPVRRRLHATA